MRLNVILIYKTFAAFIFMKAFCIPLKKNKRDWSLEGEYSATDPLVHFTLGNAEDAIEMHVITTGNPGSSDDDHTHSQRTSSEESGVRFTLGDPDANLEMKVVSQESSFGEEIRSLNEVDLEESKIPTEAPQSISGEETAEEKDSFGESQLSSQNEIQNSDRVAPAVYDEATTSNKRYDVISQYFMIKLKNRLNYAKLHQSATDPHDQSVKVLKNIVEMKNLVKKLLQNLEKNIKDLAQQYPNKKQSAQSNNALNIGTASTLPPLKVQLQLSPPEYRTIAPEETTEKPLQYFDRGNVFVIAPPPLQILNQFEDYQAKNKLEKVKEENSVNKSKEGNDLNIFIKPQQEYKIPDQLSPRKYQTIAPEETTQRRPLHYFDHANVHIIAEPPLQVVGHTKDYEAKTKAQEDKETLHSYDRGNLHIVADPPLQINDAGVYQTKGKIEEAKEPLHHFDRGNMHIVAEPPLQINDHSEDYQERNKIPETKEDTTVHNSLHDNDLNIRIHYPPQFKIQAQLSPRQNEAIGPRKTTEKSLHSFDQGSVRVIADPPLQINDHPEDYQAKNKVQEFKEQLADKQVYIEAPPPFKIVTNLGSKQRDTKREQTAENNGASRFNTEITLNTRSEVSNPAGNKKPGTNQYFLGKSAWLINYMWNKYKLSKTKKRQQEQLGMSI